MAENDMHAVALKNALEEIRKTCQNIQYAFIFKEKGEIVVGDTEIPERVMVRVVDAFGSLLEKAVPIGGVESVTLTCSEGTLSFQVFGEHYLVTVTSPKSNLNYLNTLTRVLIPTVLTMLDKISPTPLKKVPSPKDSSQTPSTSTENEEQVKTSDEEHRGDVKPETSTPEQQAIQLMVEDFEGSRIRGLLKRSDAVYVDNETVKLWENMFNGKKIEYVEIETLNGKTTRCKVKPIKDLKYSTKGVVQIPKKIQLTLEIKKGELVLVKPIIE
jgi:hypothetical protein